MTEQWYTNGLAYMKLDDDTDGMGRLMLDASVGRLKGLGVPEEKFENDPVLDMTAWGMALYWYDHRDAVGNEQSLPAGIRPLVTAYKIAYGQ